MELYLIEDHNEIYPELKGAELTEALVKDLLRDNNWITDEQIRIERQPQGKPVLPRDPQVHFSVSHTGNLFGCVISDAPVGLDIQMVTGANARRLAGRYFTDAEIEWINGGCETTADDVFADRFFRLWCRKEAYAKLTGEGLAVVVRGEPVVDRPDLEFTDLVLGDGIYGCVCCERT